VDGGQDVELDVVLLEQRQPRHRAVEAGIAALVHAVGIVHPARPIETEADEEITLPQKAAPGIVQQRAVGLQRVDHAHSRFATPLLQRHRSPEKVQPHQQRLPTLPAKGHLGHALGRDVLAGERLQHLVRHAKFGIGIQVRFGKIVAVGAVQVANRPARLEHDVKGRSKFLTGSH